MGKEMALIGADRLKGVLIQDKKENPLKIINILKSEIVYVLQNYMEISNDDLDFDIVVSNEGKYIINFSAKANRLKVANYIF